MNFSIAEHYLGRTPNEYLSRVFTDQKLRIQLEKELTSNCNVPGLVKVIMAGLDPENKTRPDILTFSRNLQALSPESTAFPSFDMGELLKVKTSADLGRFLRQFKDKDYIENPSGGMANSNLKFLYLINQAMQWRSHIYFGQNSAEKVEYAIQDLRESITTKRLPKAFTGGSWSDKEMTGLQEASVRVAVTIMNKIQQMEPECDDILAGSLLSHIITMMVDSNDYEAGLNMQRYWRGKQFMTNLVKAYNSAQPVTLNRRNP